MTLGAVGGWQRHTDGQASQLNKENLLEPLLTNWGVLPMSREKDASEQMCAGFPVLVPQGTS